MTFTKEQLIERCKSQADYAQAIIDLYPDDVGAAESRRIAEIALAALEGMEADQKGNAAVATLESHGFTWAGGQFWKPPLGLPPAYVSNERAELENYRNAQQVVPGEKVIGTFDAEKNELALLDKNMTVEKFAHWHVHNSLEVIVRPNHTAMQSGAVKDGWVMVPVEMTPEQMRAVQLKSELGADAAANLSGAYSLFSEFWRVAISAAPQQEADNDL